MNNLPELRTERTLLKILAPDEHALMLRYQLDNLAHLAPWEPARNPIFFTKTASRERVEQAHAAALAGQSYHFVAIAGGRIVATCTFSNIVLGVFQACHLGYSVDQAAQGKGLMHEVAQAGIAHVFGELKLHRIMANHAPDNVRSARLLARLGFEREGLARAYLKINGAWQDMVLNSLINPQQG